MEFVNFEEIVKTHIVDLKGVDYSLLEKDVSACLLYSDPFIALDQLAKVCSDKMYIHPNYGLLAGRIYTEIILATTPKTFSESTEKLKSILYPEYYEFVISHSKELDEMVDRSRNFTFDYFAICTLKKSYLAFLSDGEKSSIMETPQFMYLRIATYIHYPDLDKIKKTYDDISLGNYTHASPTMFNCGMKRPQLASCFLMTVGDDINSIADSWRIQAIISKNSGGIGADYSHIRHSEIGQRGVSKGIVPWLKITNEILKAVDQCFDPDTIVYTREGPKRISDIVPGDVMIRSDGRENAVSKVLHYPYDPSKHKMREIVLENSKPVVVADCHPMLSIYSPKEIPLEDLGKNIKAGVVSPVYTDVKDLDHNWLVAFPIPTYFRDIPTFSESDCRMYGIIMGNISLRVDWDGHKFFIKNTPKVNHFVREYLQSKGILYQETFDYFTWEKNNLFPFTKNMFFDSSRASLDIPANILNLPKNKVSNLIKGYLESIPSFRDKNFTIIYPHTDIFEKVKFILLKLGIVPIFKEGYFYIPETKEFCEAISLHKTQYSLGNIKYKNQVWVRVISNVAKREFENSSIVDLEMDYSNSTTEISSNYLTSIGQAHNGGKRKGSGTVYLRDCHVDIYEFTELRDEGPEDMRVKELFLAIMVSDLFMRKVENDEMWSLFCPNRAKGLFDKWGIDFEMAYNMAESKKLYTRQIRARDLWEHILTMQIRKGMPFILYMDACNRKSNQRHSGVINCSNLCTEILQVTSPKEIASCNIASVSLNKCVFSDSRGVYFDFTKLEEHVSSLVRNLNNVIDRNYYPSEIEQIEYSNKRHRPIGIGVQGLADAAAMLDISWVTRDGNGELIISREIQELNEQIFESIYYAAIKESIELAKKQGAYETFEGSPASQGKFQFDLWLEEEKEKEALSEVYGVKNLMEKKSLAFSVHTKEQWEVLRGEMKTHGLRNSLLVALMPTASSAQILGNSECFDPFTELIYARYVLSGQFMVVNKHLHKDLSALGMWTTEVVRSIIGNRGSLKDVPPPLDEGKKKRFEFLKLKYTTAFEMPQKVLVQLSVNRGKYICQTQSLNCYMSKPNKKLLHAYHFYGWKNGIKTGMYYLRQKAISEPINNAITSIVVPSARQVECNDEVCIVCQT